MGKSRNPVTDGFSGKLGDSLLFRQVNGRSTFGLVPQRTKKQPTAKQQAVRNRFKIAAAYAAAEMSDAASRALYEDAAARKGNGINAHTLALTDFLKPPVVSLVDTRLYNGTVGSKITVHAQDELEVKTLTVTVLNADGTVVETGAAVARPGGLIWDYTATVVKADVATGKVRVVTTDRPGNTSTTEQSLSQSTAA